MKMLTMRTSWLVITLTMLLGACDSDSGIDDYANNDTIQQSLQPTVRALEKDSLVIGETLHFYGENFLHPDDGQTFLVFEGKYIWTDGENEVHEQIPAFTIKGLYDGEFPAGGKIGDKTLDGGTSILRWNRFGPFEVPFGGSGRHVGIFEGTVKALNVTSEGSEYKDDQPLDVRLEIKPSILLTRLEPVIGYTEDNQAITPECGSPALRILGGLPYIIEVETMGFEPAFFNYKISNANNSDTWVEFMHPATGTKDTLGAPDPNRAEIVVFNPVADTDESSYASIQVTAIDANNNTVEMMLPIRIVRPMAFFYDGNRQIAEYYEPQLVSGAIPGSIGSKVTYSETKSESRQRGVSISVSQSFTEGQGMSQTSNWSEGFGLTNSSSATNSVGQSHSEGASSSESYGTSYSQSAGSNVNLSSTDGTSWGWTSTDSESSEEFQNNTESAYGDVSLGMNTEVSGEGSIPGFAKVGGKVGTSVGTTVGAKNDTTEGVKSGTSSSHGMHMDSSSSDTVGYGSTTTDTASSSVSGTYAVTSQSSMNSSTSQTASTSESLTYQMGGSAGLTENYTKGESESWTETWQTSETDTTLLAFSSDVPNGKCAVIYRQTVRHVKTAQLYAYDRCGVRSLVGEMHFNEWSWAPNIAIGDKCDEGSLPEPDFPKAACLHACE